MTRFDRKYVPDRLLKQRRNPVPLSSIEQSLECSPATAKPAIQALRHYLNAPIEYDRERRGYYYQASADGEIRFEHPGLWLNKTERYTLLASYQLLGDVQPGLLEEHIAPLRARIDKLLDSAAMKSSREHCAVLQFTAQASHWAADESWHARPQNRILSDGALELRIPYKNPTELIMDILKYGPGVEVLSPETCGKPISTGSRRL